MQYLIDVGSSTIKVYKRTEENLEFLFSKTFDFNGDFDKENFQLSSKNTIVLYDFFKNLSYNYGLNKRNTKIFATGVFRDILNKDQFISEFYKNTCLYFNIISHELEAFYLENLWRIISQKNNSFIVVNIGGKTTELILYKEGNIQKKELLNIGVGTLKEKFPNINSKLCRKETNLIFEWIKKELPADICEMETAIYTGGELSFMKDTGYALQQNTSFLDKKHPYMVTLDNYLNRNEFIYYDITIEELKKMKSDNPEWMDGARACSAIAQSIFLHYGVKQIVPSDSNLIDGVNIQEVKNVVLCGSYRKHLKRISELIDLLRKKNIEVLSPKSTKVVGEENGFILFENDQMLNHCTWPIEKSHLNAIDFCDCIIVCNYDNYVGPKTAFEIGYAYSIGKKIVFIENNSVIDDFDIPSEAFFLSSVV
jgi:hypothetical protein